MPGVVGLLLAAGTATRFGSNKLLHRFDDGRTLVETAAAHLLDALASSIAVIRPGDDALEALLLDAGMRVIACPLAERGMGHSLACGVAASTEADAWVVALADMPYIQPATIRSVVSGLRSGAAIVAPYFAGRRGHPVGFARESYKELLSLEQDIGARLLLERHAGNVHRMDVDDPGILLDVDTPGDLARPLLCPV
jgi:molybdenum cofactor cytidylyltransferase